MPKPKILITGASRGIGLAIARALAGSWSLVLHATKQPAELPAIDGEHSWLFADFADADALRSFCATLKSEHGDALFGVVNNAGLTLDKSLVFQPEKDIDKLLAVNLKAPIMISKTAFKLFVARKSGVILNVSSVTAHSGNAFQAVYTATKAGLEAFTKSLAKEAAAINRENDIRCLCIAPGFIETDMTGAIPSAEREKYKDLIPLNRFGAADDVGRLAAFLLSEQAAFINGTTVHVNGGML